MERIFARKFLRRGMGKFFNALLSEYASEAKARMLSYDNGGMTVDQDVRNLEFMLLSKEKVCLTVYVQKSIFIRSKHFTAHFLK